MTRWIHAIVRMCVCVRVRVFVSVSSSGKLFKYSLGAHGFCLEHGHPVLGLDSTFALHVKHRVRNMSHNFS